MTGQSDFLANGVDFGGRVRVWSICPEADNLSPSIDFIKTGPWLRSFESWDKLCLGEATTPFIFSSISV
jgi:hypothetical protein